MRKIPVPRHRYSPLKENWMKIFEPIVEHLKLQIRFNLKTRNVEVRTCKDTEDVTQLQKAADFVKVSSLVHSHWSRNVEARLSLVETFPSV